VSVTPFLRLQKPPFDTVPWDDAINGNMDTIDAFASRYMAVPNFVGIWTNSTDYIVGQVALDSTSGKMYVALVTHTSGGSPSTFADDRAANPSYWQLNDTTTYAPLASPALTGNPTAPTPAAGDSDTSIATTAYVQAVAQGHNYIHNPLFNLSQRTGPFTTNNTITIDRWRMLFAGGGSLQVSQQPHDDTSRGQIGDETAEYFLYAEAVAGSNPTDNKIVEQKIENVRRLAGKTVTVSFWAKSTGTAIGVSLAQNFGTGGSPSADVFTSGVNVPVSTTWARHTATIALPSIAGKTLGSNGDSGTRVLFWLSGGTDSGSASGGIGLKTQNVSLWGVQLEVGSVATQLERIESQTNVANCQRFYQAGSVLAASYGTIGTQIYAQVGLPTTMRAVPNVVSANNGSSNITTPVVTASGSALSAVFGGGTVTATGAYLLNCTYTASAEL
jgi:hypothetical protein